jgi:HTH-type transcriptional repressor of NAD biosynthesis genes
MLKGLIIGKFMPLTKGHIGLIDFGIANCDELIVAVCTLKSEPIAGELRYNWVKEYYNGNKKVRVVHITDEIPSTSESMRETTKLWAAYLKKAFPEVNLIFASEPYGEYIAEYMDADYKLFDVERKTIPISATMIRNNPLKYWDYIPDIVKPYFSNISEDITE